MKNINESGFGYEEENSPEREKVREIMQRSKQFIVVCGPSGCGKTMAIKHIVKKYGFVEPPFFTTRDLRPGEQEIGGAHMELNEFMESKMNGGMFLAARNYGNAYGYDLDKVYHGAIEGNNNVVEAPASNLTTDVSYFLPESMIIAVLPETAEEVEVRLNQRGLNDDIDKRIRLLNSEIEKEHILRSAKIIRINEITPTHGVPQDTISQIDELMAKKGFQNKE